MSVVEDAFKSPLGMLEDVTEIFTGAKAAEEAQRRAEEDRAKAQVAAQAARVFSETEGQGLGTIGEVVFSVDDEEEDSVTNKVFRY